jgi:hypothetical protein
MAGGPGKTPAIGQAIDCPAGGKNLPTGRQSTPAASTAFAENPCETWRKRDGTTDAPRRQTMNSTVQFRSHLAFGGEILTQQATFLPVESPCQRDEAPFYMLKMQHFAGFPLFFKMNRKNSTVAQPLLKEDLR